MVYAYDPVERCSDSPVVAWSLTPECHFFEIFRLRQVLKLEFLVTY